MEHKNKLEWSELFSILKVFRKLEPWKFISENQLFIMHLKDRNFPIVFQIIGQLGECPGVIIYNTRRGQKILSSIMYGTVDIVDPLSYPVSLQEAAIVYFNNRDELSFEEYRLIKDLGYSFRGKHQWPSFTNFKSDEIPREFNKSEIILFNRCLRLFLGLLNSDVINNTEGGHYILGEPGVEVNTEFNLYEDNQLKPATFKNKVLVKRLQKQPLEEIELEMSYVYTDMLNDKEEVVPFFMMVDDDGFIVKGDFIEYPKTLMTKIQKGLVEFIELFGRPKVIKVRVEDLYCELFDLCDQLDIKLVIDPNLERFDEAYLEMRGSLEML